ncbi:2-aminoethylphosphonate--pyruvate transaminase [Chitinophaga sp. 30R24]|uniref:2-aminoethylphosphonate--pyruvate transaminase n=1 Tax=Chitinophaga sp. 30R24 TaxID=3248838 RepID=UPI003B91E148
MEQPYILLTPGPLMTSETVKKTMLRDWCTWDDDYNINIVQDIRARLVSLATKQTSDYTSVLLQGSGTFSVEGTLISTIPANGKLLILSNGAYGDRMQQIAEYANIPHDKITWIESETVSPSKVDDYLSCHTDITHVSFVHCETTTGILNPLQEICSVVKKHNKCLIVDAISSFGGIPYDIGELKIDFLIGSSNKCLQGVPGFGFILVRKEALLQCKGNARSLSLDIFAQWDTMEKQSGKWRFTSPTHVVRAFKQALDELDEEGGISERHRRYQENHKILMEGMQAIGFEPLLDTFLQSPIISSFLYPTPSFSFNSFYKELKEKGFVIYPGKISEKETFRIGTIGEVYPDDFKRLIAAIATIDVSKNLKGNGSQK